MPLYTPVTGMTEIPKEALNRAHPVSFLDIYIVCIAYQLSSLKLNYKMTTIYLGRAGANVATLKAHLKNGRTCMKLSPVDTSLLLESTYGGNTQQSK